MDVRRGFHALIVALVIVPLAGRAIAVEIVASDDTWVREDNATSNRNGDLQMNARTDSDADDNDVILLRFDTTSIAGPVAGAELRLLWYRSDSTSSRSLILYGLNETHAGETTWTEEDVVYDTAPGLLPDGMDPAAEVGLGNSDDDIQDLDTANLTLLLGPVGYGPQAEGETYTFSGDGLDAFINADTNGQVTFLLLRDISTSANQARFMTKENTSSDTGFVTGDEGFAAPRLVIPVAVEVPALGGWALLLLALGLGAIGSVVLRSAAKRRPRIAHALFPTSCFTSSKRWE